MKIYWIVLKHYISMEKFEIKIGNQNRWFLDFKEYIGLPFISFFFSL